MGLVNACCFCGAKNEPGDEICFRCGKALSPITEGTVIGGRYAILSRLGKGGMGVVYRAHDRELDEIVAIKVLRSDVAQSPDLIRRFRSEIKLARRVSHRNVCRIHEFGKENKLDYIVMEFVQGVDLKQILREEHPLAHRVAYEIAIQVASGLQAIHEAGVIHRDLKAQNIMRDVRGVVKLMDFGIAKSLGSGTAGATAAGQIVGTPEYMSPEQVRGEKIDTRSDIYALGVVLFELFTGEVPFRGDTPVATMFKHIQDSPPLERPAAKALPGPLMHVLLKALAKSRNDRYSSAEDVREALSQAWSATLAEGPSSLRASALPSPSQQLPETTPLPTPSPRPARTPEADVVPGSISAVDATAEQGTVRHQATTLREAAPVVPLVRRPREAPRRHPPQTAALRPRWVRLLVLGGLAIAGTLFLVRPRPPKNAADATASSQGLKTSPATNAPAVPPSSPTSTRIPSAGPTTGILVIDALPWAEVARIVDPAGREQDLAGQRYTPMVLRLPPGTYRVTLVGDAGKRAILAEAAVEASRTTTVLREFQKVIAADYFRKVPWQ